MVGNNNPRDPYNLIVRDRRIRAMELRKQGLTYRDICTLIKKEFGDDCPQGYNERHAWNDVDNKLKEVAKDSTETAQQVLQLELQRLDDLLMVCMNAALGGDLKAVDRVLMIMKRRSSYLGLDKPATYVINTWQNEIIDLLKAGKVTIGQVRKELGDELTKQLLESGQVTEIANTQDVNTIDAEFVETPAAV